MPAGYQCRGELVCISGAQRMDAEQPLRLVAHLRSGGDFDPLISE